MGVVFLSLAGLLLGTAVSVQEDAVSPAELKKTLKAEKEPQKRKELLTQIATLAVDGDAKYAQDCTKIIASGVEDEDLGVRQEAVRLLLLGPAKGTAVERLTAGLEALREETAKLGRGAFGGGGGRGGFGGGAESEDPEVAAKAAEQRAAVQQRADYAKALIDGIVSLPDDRSVAAISDFIDRAPEQVMDRYRVDLIGGLLQLGSRDAVAKVIDLLPLLSDPAARAGKAPPPNQGGGGRGGRRPSDGKDLHSLLARFATKHELGEAPEWGAEGPDNWAKWFAKNRKDLPAKLGKLSDPK